MTQRTFFVGGNHKCNGSKDSLKTLVEELNNATIPPKSIVDVVISPPSIYLSYVQGLVSNRLEVSAQNCESESKGAFTGEISAEMVKDVGAGWVILGHSERRKLFGESGAYIAKKAKHALLDVGLSTIICVGEQLEDRKQELTEKVLEQQMSDFSTSVIPLSAWNRVVIAYEPVWAIGTGLSASPEQAQHAHQFIRQWLQKNISPEVAEHTRIIYGGSVSAANCSSLSTQPDVDGFLVGGASLVAKDFITIINSATLSHSKI
eukprot:gene4029-5043_t